MDNFDDCIVLDCDEKWGEREIVEFDDEQETVSFRSQYRDVDGNWMTWQDIGWTLSYGEIGRVYAIVEDRRRRKEDRDGSDKK